MTSQLKNEPLRKMTSTMKILPWVLPLGILLLIVVIYHSSNNPGYADDTERNAVEPQIIPRRRRAIGPTIHYCKSTQYYDQEEGRCLGVPGGGKVLHVENRQSCGINVLKPHCKSSLYYHICKRDKSILAQCANRQIFNSRLQRCVYYDSSQFTPNIISPESYMYYNHIGVPSCTMSGRFPVLGHCSMFYTCDTNGHRFYQNVFKCPQNTGYQVDRGVCNVASDCLNDNSVNTVCVPDAPSENVESLSLDTVRSMKEPSEIFEGRQVDADDPIVEKEKNVNSLVYETNEETQDVTTKQYRNNEDSVVPSNFNVDSVDPYSAPTINNTPESIPINDVSPNIDEKMQDAPEEQYKNNEDGAVNPTNFNTDSVDVPSMPPISDVSESSPINDDELSNIDETLQDAPVEQYKNNEDSAINPTNLSTDSVNVRSMPTVSDVPEISSISDTLPNADENIQDAPVEQYKNNEDSAVNPTNFNADSDDVPSMPTVSDVPKLSPISDESPNIDETLQDAPVGQYENNEDSPINPTNFNTDAIDMHSMPPVNTVPELPPISDESPNIDETLQDAPVEQYKNNEDSAINSTNFNTDAIDMHSMPPISDVSESSPINDELSNIDEAMQDAPVEQYKNNEDSAINPTNFNTDAINMHSMPPVNAVPELPPISDESPNIDETLQDAPVEQYKNNEDSAINPTNLNTDSVDVRSMPTVSDVPEISSISDTLPNADENIQDAPVEQYKNNEDGAVNPTNFNADSDDVPSMPTVSDVPELSPISDESPNIDETLQDAPVGQYENNEDSAINPTNFNTDAIDMHSMPPVSEVPESSPINDELPNIDEAMQDAPVEQYKNNEDSAVNPTNFNTDSVDMRSMPTINNIPELPPVNAESPNIDETLQDAPVEQYNNNEDSAINPTNFNTDSVDVPTVNDVPEISSISDTLPNADENIQDASVEQYKNNEDSAIDPMNFNTDSVDMRSMPPVSDVPELSPISDESLNIDEAIQDAPVEQYKNNEDSAVNPTNFNADSVDVPLMPTVSDVSEASPINDVSPNIDKEMQDTFSEQYKNNEDEIQDEPAAHSKEITTLTDIPTTIPSIQDPSISDTDPVQNSKDSMETSFNE